MGDAWHAPECLRVKASKGRAALVPGQRQSLRTSDFAFAIAFATPKLNCVACSQQNVDQTSWSESECIKDVEELAF